MYNGIGLATARGSGTNAYVQKNLSFTNKLKQKVEYKTEEDIRKLEATVNRPANQAILAHQRKRQIELKCLEMREKMEEEGYSEEEIVKKVAAHRETLTAKAEEAARMKEMLFKFDENGRPFVKETHQMAEINQERNDKLKRALGINENFVEGSSLDIDRRSKEIAEKTEPNEHQLRDNTFSPVLSSKSHSKKTIECSEAKEADTQKTEKNKEKKTEQKHRESDNETTVKEIPKKYAYDDRKCSKRSRSRDKYTSKKDHSRSQKVDRHYSRRKRSRHDRDSNSSSSSRERKNRRSTRQTRRSRSPSSTSSSSSSISSSSSPSRRRSSSSSSSRMSSRSPPIRRRRGSPNFLEKRRITSARKRPVPYHRRSPSYDSDSLFSVSSNDSSFSSLSTVSRKRCDWRRSSHKSISNSLTEIT